MENKDEISQKTEQQIRRGKIREEESENVKYPTRRSKMGITAASKRERGENGGEDIPRT